MSPHLKNSAERFSISAKVTISVSDQLDWYFADLGWIRLYVGLSIICAVLLFVQEVVFRSGFSLHAIMLATMVAVVCPILLIPLNIAFLAIGFLRLSDSQRTLCWTIGNFGLSLTDAAGNKVEIPWAEVQTFSERKNGYLLKLGAMGSRWIPKRAFQEADLTRVTRLANQMLEN